MQDPSIYSQIKPPFPEQEHLKCPRCDSPNTKFCYYNNYNLSQPRHYCKSCRRYWTKGGTLRNIPVGGGSRKNTKRSSSSSKKSSSTTSSSVSSATPPLTSSVSSSSSTHPKPEPFGIPPIPSFDQNSRVIDVTTGPFSSLLESSEPQFGNLLEALNPNNNGSNLQLGEFSRNPNSSSGLGSGSGSGSGSDTNHQNGNNAYLGVQNGGDSNNCWNGGNNGWPDLAIYTPGSNFQ